MKCRSPHCPTDRVEGSRFCAWHRDLFASVAQEIDDGKESRRRTPERVRPGQVKRCDWGGCPEPAVEREPYCGFHLGVLSGSTA